MRMASSASWVTTMQVARVSCRMASVSSRILAQARIETGERLVHEQHARPGRNGAGERHALLLAAREDMRILVRVMGKPDPVSAARASAGRLAAASGI